MCASAAANRRWAPSCWKPVTAATTFYIRVQDDGGGIDVRRIKAKLIDRQLLSASAVAELSDDQALDYIWHPGFSTAKEVTDVSGRGVGHGRRQDADQHSERDDRSRLDAAARNVLHAFGCR